MAKRNRVLQKMQDVQMRACSRESAGYCPSRKNSEFSSVTYSEGRSLSIGTVTDWSEACTVTLPSVCGAGTLVAK